LQCWSFERFGQGQLHQGSGLASTRSGEVLIADAATGKIDVYEPEPAGAPQMARSRARPFRQPRPVPHNGLTSCLSLVMIYQD